MSDNPQDTVSYEILFPSSISEGAKPADITIQLHQNDRNISEITGDSMLKALTAQTSPHRDPALLEKIGMSPNHPYELIPGLHCRIVKEDVNDPSPVLEFWADPKANVPLSREGRLAQIPALLKRGGIPRTVTSDMSARIALEFPEMDLSPD